MVDICDQSGLGVLQPLTVMFCIAQFLIGEAAAVEHMACDHRGSKCLNLLKQASSGSTCPVSFLFPLKRKHHLDLKLSQNASCSVRSNLFGELQLEKSVHGVLQNPWPLKKCSKNKNVCWLCDTATHVSTNHRNKNCRK
jgi:hypothetical protein